MVQFQFKVTYLTDNASQAYYVLAIVLQVPGVAKRRPSSLFHLRHTRIVGRVNDAYS